MKFINYLSTAAIPVVIVIIILYGIIERKRYMIFFRWCKDGIQIVIQLIPTLIGIFVAAGALRNSGIIDLIVKVISPVTDILKIPSEIMPLALLRPISGSASIGVAVDIMQKYGTDTFLGLITSTIMGSTETTLYTIAVYTGCVGIKKTRFVLLAALLADLAGMVASVAIWRILS